MYQSVREWRKVKEGIVKRVVLPCIPLMDAFYIHVLLTFGRIYIASEPFIGIRIVKTLAIKFFTFLDYLMSIKSSNHTKKLLIKMRPSTKGLNRYRRSRRKIK